MLVLGLTLAAIVMVNASVIVLLHTANMILRPVDQLVVASRELALERFDHRVQIDQEDEFGELAHAYNQLAEQLKANEQRKMETLRQVAVALNHDLNNTLAAIELELRLADLQTGGDPKLAERFKRMHKSVARVAKAVRSLAEVRRIVLTEYMPGQLMLDLERSVSDGDARRRPMSRRRRRGPRTRRARHPSTVGRVQPLRGAAARGGRAAVGAPGSRAALAHAAALAQGRCLCWARPWVCCWPTHRTAGVDRRDRAGDRRQQRGGHAP